MALHVAAMIGFTIIFAVGVAGFYRFFMARQDEESANGTDAGLNRTDNYGSGGFKVGSDEEKNGRNQPSDE